MRLRSSLFSVLALFALVWAAGCTTEPKTEARREALQADGKATLRSLEAIDPGLQSVVENSYAYIVFPDIGKGGFLIGGAWGRGVVYEQGRFVGYASVAEGSVGATAGGQTFSELVVFNSREAFRKFQSDHLSFGADASAVALRAGAAKSAEFRNNVAVFVSNQGGLMVDASVKGQNIGFVAADQVD